MRRVKADTPAPTRRPPKRRWLRPVLLSSAALAVLGATGAGLWWLDRSGIVQRAQSEIKSAFVAATSELGLVVDDITVEGRNRQDADQILAALGLRRGDAILLADLDLTRARLEALAWVREATIERHLPGRLHIRLVEREPIALWQRAGRFMLIDRGGTEIGPDLTGEFASLPVVVGPDAPQHASALFAALAAEPALAARVKAAVRVGGRRWNVKLDDIAGGIDIRLPEAQTSAAWTRLARLERDYQLLEKKLLMIDLRLPDRLVVGTPEDPAATQAPGKKSKPNDKDA
ncbi:MAG: FtsQ-type POTRA domain-containing protein [Rhodospirillales bacterium]|nr:MAG: FtsQ-type POTRA domain-containing protein [Rhodospirillales bacterium]